MAQTRFTCTPTWADELECRGYVRVTIIDSEGTAARGCPRHAVAALNGLTGAHVDWADSKGLNEWERQADFVRLNGPRLFASLDRDHGPGARPVVRKK